MSASDRSSLKPDSSATFFVPSANTSSRKCAGVFERAREFLFSLFPWYSSRVSEKKEKRETNWERQRIQTWIYYWEWQRDGERGRRWTLLLFHGIILSWSSTFIAAIMDDDEIWVVFLVIIFVVRTLERLPAWLQEYPSDGMEWPRIKSN